MTARAELRREALLDAAAIVFADKGLERATVADVAARAGVAKGSVYRSFESKEALLVALKDRFLARMLDRAAPIFARVGTDDIWTLCDEMVAVMIDFQIEHRDIIRLLAHLPASVELDDSDVQAMLVAGIRVGIAAGTFAVDDPEMVAIQIEEAIHGTTRRLLLAEGAVDRERLVRGSTALVRRVLAG